MLDYVNLISTESRDDHGNIFFTGDGYRVHINSIKGGWSNARQGVGPLALLFSKNLSTEERLKAANPASNIKLTTEAPNHPINVIQKDDSLEKDINTYFKQAFGLDLVVHRNAGSHTFHYMLVKHLRLE